MVGSQLGACRDHGKDMETIAWKANSLSCGWGEMFLRPYFFNFFSYFAGGPSLIFMFFDLLILLEQDLEPKKITKGLMMWEAWIGVVYLKQAI